MQKIPCLVVCEDGPQLYGGGKMMLRLLRGLSSSELLQPVAALTRSGMLAETLKSQLGNRVRVFPGIDLRKPVSVRSFIKSLQRLGIYISKEEIRVAVVQNRRLLLTTAPVLKRMGIPTIWQVGLGFTSPMQRRLNKMSSALAHRIVIESQQQAVQNFCSELIHDKLDVVEKGIDFVAPRGPSLSRALCTPPLRIGTVASMNPRKGIDLLIEASALAKDVVSEVWIAGSARSDSERRYQEKLYDLASGIESPTIRWCGWTRNIDQFYRSLDIFVLCSENEGISGAVREAMSMGLPVITTNVGGMSDLVSHNETGILLRASDSHGLATALRELSENPHFRRKLGDAAMKSVRERFAIEHFIQRYERILSEAAAPASGASRTENRRSS